MNWGNRLLLVFFAFGGLMFYMAYRSFKVNVDLVEKDYYKTELKYQEVIDGAKRANALSSKVVLNQDGKFVTVQFPEEMKNTTVSGTVWFYCASDAKKDRHIDLKVNTAAEQQIEKSKLIPGDYTVKFDWSSNNQKYYTEEAFKVL
jgi:predicted DNA-binding protein (MmcQ/YjbR family)